MSREDTMPTVTPLSDAKRKLLEKFLQGEFAIPTEENATISKRQSDELAPLALSQEQVLIREQMVPKIPPLYNESATVYRFGPLDVEILERSFTEIIRRHEIWRTTYAIRHGKGVQVVHPAPERFRLQLVDLRSMPADRRSAEAHRLGSEEARRPFDMQQGPLVRATLIQFHETEHRLCLIVHQSILDGVSVYQVLLRELAALYEAFYTGKPSPLPDQPIQFGDFASWQRGWLKGQVLEREMVYWKKQLAGELPALAWPTERPRPATESFRGSIEPFTFPESLSSAVRALSQQWESTLFVVLLTGFIGLLYNYTLQDDIIVGTVSPAGRKRSEAQKLMGYFLNPVPLRFHLAGAETFHDLLHKVQDVVSGAISHDDVPFEYLVRELQPKADPSRNPFFTVAASLEPPLADVGPQWSLTPMDVESGGARWDLYFVWDDRPTGMIGRVQYNPDLFQRETVGSMVRDFQLLLARVVLDPGLKIAALCPDSPA